MVIINSNGTSDDNINLVMIIMLRYKITEIAIW